MNEDNLPHEGYATYRLTVDLHEDDQNELMSLYIPRVYSAHRTWVNDELLHEQGVVGVDRSDMEPDEYSQALPFQTDSDQLEIILQVSNFTQRAGGIWGPIMIGTEEDISAYREDNVTETTFFVGSLITMGLVFICFYLFRRKNRSPLYFGILCIAVALQTFLQGDKFSSLETMWLRSRSHHLA
ncbi:hypothetical protein HUG20_18100 [Salicibibacter cibi]|uniref:7TM-DISM receptor extracellular domain-containing protein n=1 Tax=Salicibibacter cibi TaxID=2743001 RepID=A0A7T6ZDS6_9BACI|nr:7TM diverse intracellular signaling domain-containing protein [Salicibibacter cibi]QQK81639.1 hypothetical protein HUG20_18100 [Salicibibacter cibi]